jgi:hypothetical protein
MAFKIAIIQGCLVFGELFFVSVSILLCFQLLFSTLLIGNSFFCNSKAEFAEEGTFFVNIFPSLRTFVNKNVGI